MDAVTTYSPLFSVLANGEWVRHGMIWRWHPAPPETVERPADFTPHDLIACPVCLARMDEHCRRSNGRGSAHAARLVKRVCVCGGPIRPKEPMCGFCRAEAAREMSVA